MTKILINNINPMPSVYNVMLNRMVSNKTHLLAKVSRFAYKPQKGNGIKSLSPKFKIKMHFRW